MSLDQGSLDQGYQTIKVNNIIEATPGKGVDIDGLIVKDEGINFPTNDARIYTDGLSRVRIKNIAMDAIAYLMTDYIYAVELIKADSIIEYTVDDGITIDGNLLKDANIVKMLGLGSANQVLKPVTGLNSPTDHVVFDEERTLWNWLGDGDLPLLIDLPRTLGTMKLHLTGWELYVNLIGGSDKIDNVFVVGQEDDLTIDILDTYATDITTTGLVTHNFSPIDVSAYTLLTLTIQPDFIASLRVSGAAIKYYYE